MNFCPHSVRHDQLFFTVSHVPLTQKNQRCSLSCFPHAKRIKFARQKQQFFLQEKQLVCFVPELTSSWKFEGCPWKVWKPRKVLRQLWPVHKNRNKNKSCFVTQRSHFVFVSVFFCFVCASLLTETNFLHLCAKWLFCVKKIRQMDRLDFFLAQTAWERAQRTMALHGGLCRMTVVLH